MEFISLFLLAFTLALTVGQPRDTILNFLAEEDCLLYIIRKGSSDKAITQLPHVSLLRATSGNKKTKSLTSEQRTLYEQEKLLVLLPFLHERYHPMVLEQEECACSAEMSLKLRTNDVDEAESALFMAYTGKCVNFLVFEDDPTKIQKIMLYHKWLPSARTTFLIMSDLFSIPESTRGWWDTEIPLKVILAGENKYSLERKFRHVLGQFRKCQAPVLISLHGGHSRQEEHLGDVRELDERTSMWFYDHLHFGILCQYCQFEEQIHLLNRRTEYTAKAIQQHHFILNQNNGHGAAALVDNVSAKWDTYANFQDCEMTQYFNTQIANRSCNFHGVFLGILSKALNFTVTTGDFDVSQGENVLELCITFCYTREKYTYKEPVRIFVLATETTRMLYCKRQVALENRDWSFLWQSFDMYVWICMFVTPVLLAAVAKSSLKGKIAMEFFSMLLGQSWKHQSYWSRGRSFGFGLCFLMPVLLSIWYQGDVTSELIVPLRQSTIRSISDLFVRFKYKTIVGALPGADETQHATEFRRIGLAYNVSKYYMEDRDLVGTSPASAYERGSIIGKYTDRGATVVDQTMVEYALAIAKKKWGNKTSCNYVKQRWISYWNTWLIKSHLSDAVHMHKFRLMQAGIVNFWHDLFQNERSRLVRTGITRTLQELLFKPLSMQSPLSVIFKLYGVLMAFATFCFLSEILYSITKKKIKKMYYNLRIFAK